MASAYQQALAILAGIRELSQGITNQATANAQKEAITAKWTSLLVAVDNHCDAGEKMNEEYEKAEEQYAKFVDQANTSRGLGAEKGRIRKSHLCNTNLLSTKVANLRQEAKDDRKLPSDEATKVFNRVSMSHDLLVANLELARLDKEYAKSQQDVEKGTARIELAEEEKKTLLTKAEAFCEEMCCLQAEICLVADLVGIEVRFSEPDNSQSACP